MPVAIVFLVSWAALELKVAGRSLTAASELFNGPTVNRSVGTIIVAVLAAFFLVVGPQLVVRTWVKWFAFWAGLGVMLILVWRVVADLDLVMMLEQPPGAHFWLGVDLVVAGAVIFFPLVADTARFAPDQGTAASRVAPDTGSRPSSQSSSGDWLQQPTARDRANSCGHGRRLLWFLRRSLWSCAGGPVALRR